ncbi:hypothetical protein [uncultured Algibacter sp.]|uniref:hypothetical protein n=1 Tax=uncultured Algibacter sp. TaxID=298659 RepID=UPI00263237F5|nr:hypothetical protein [uncultured Algibacter sp.]
MMYKFTLLYFTLLCFCNLSFSQIGINTTDPTKDLDVNGELRIRNLPINNLATSVLTADADGNISKSQNFVLWDVDSQVAVVPVNYSTSADIIVNNIDLGLSIVVTIPANVEARIIMNYSVPMGLASFTEPVGYYGIRFLKDGVEAPSGSRKFSVLNNSDNQEETANMITISNVYTENLASAAAVRTITYTLNGYIEQLRSGITHNYRFNMWDANPPNYNWGRATLTKTVYIK